jgi:tetratricopeptide (TPR) repeat protein
LFACRSLTPLLRCDFAAPLSNVALYLGAAAAIYSTAIAINPEKINATTFKRVGDHRLMQGQVSEPAEYLSRAMNAASRSDVPPSERRSLGRIYENLGIALEQAGSVEPAMRSYRAAIQHGNSDAKKGIETLERRTVERLPQPEQSSGDVPSSGPAQDTTSPPRSGSESLPAQESFRRQEVIPNRVAPQQSLRRQEVIRNRVAPQEPLLR